MEKSSNETLSQKLIIYDSNCRVCIGLKNLLAKLAPYVKDQIVALKDLPDQFAGKIDPDRFKNEMALVDKGKFATKYGAEGVGFIFSSKSGLFAGLFKSSVFKNLFTFLYKTIAFNRYVIALPKSLFKCDCYPESSAKYRLTYIFITISISIVLTAFFGISLKDFVPEVSATAAAFQMTLIAGTGWVFQIATALVFLKEKSLDYIGHLGTIMVTGLLVLLPWILFQALVGVNVILFPITSVLVSSGLMLFIHIKRVRFLELHYAWSISWFLFLQLTAIFWIYIFFLNN